MTTVVNGEIITLAKLDKKNLGTCNGCHYLREYKGDNPLEGDGQECKSPTLLDCDTEDMHHVWRKVGEV